MIGKIITGKSFRGCLSYCLNDKIHDHLTGRQTKNRAEVLMFNHCFGNEKELVQQFNEVRALNPKLSKPVLHITLSLAPGEYLGRQKLIEMIEHCATDFGYANNQYLAIYHNDTSHQHLHIIANRVGYDKRTVSDGNSYQKMAEFCRKMELKYHLKQVLSPRRFLAKEQRNIPRNDRRKEQITEHLRQALNRTTHYHQFEKKMQEKGYQVLKGRGIAFIDDKKVKVKGSELNYSLQRIERVMETNRLIYLKELPERFKLQSAGSTIVSKLPNKDQAQESEEKSLHGRLNRIKDTSLQDLAKDLGATVTELMKPEEDIEPLPKELMPRKKQRKRKRLRHW